MYNIKLLLEFDGTSYSGWLRQGNENISTVQETVEKAIFDLTGTRVEITGCSRTDAGVHAVNYVTNFQIDTLIPPENFYKALNPFLPDNIKAKISCKVEDDFHATYSAKRKTRSSTKHKKHRKRSLF